MNALFNGIYHGKRAFVTGHTGFKGSWLSFWLRALGARVTGYARKPVTDPNHFDLLELDIQSIIGDILNLDLLKKSMREAAPDIVFHLAAQPLVRDSYDNPVETYGSNVMGTLHVLEAARQSPSVRAIVVITTDKVYENREWHWGYREIDRLGGYDPYSSSKACAEILCSSYRNSFLNRNDYGARHNILMTTARAGNVIAGGDWSKDRLVPDIVKATIEKKSTVIRNPSATRPWQHVLDCLSGYLMAGQSLLDGRIDTADSFNFGPSETDELQVKRVCELIRGVWPSVQFEFPALKEQPHESGMLRLDCTKARVELGWEPVWNSREAITATIVWYRRYYENKTPASEDDLARYIRDAKQRNMVWS